MSRAVDTAARFVSEKANPKLKNGTNASAKPRGEVSLSQPRWDMGPAVLAVLGDVPDMVRQFRAHLRKRPRDREIVTASPPAGETKKQKAARESRATTITRQWMEWNGYTVKVEARGEVDPDTGKRINPNGVKGARRMDMLEVYHRRGWISDRGYIAGEALRDAWGATQRGTGTDWSMERVDSSPKPDAHIDIQIDRVSRLITVSNLIPSDDTDIVFAVACDGHAISRLKRYRGINHERGKAHLRAALERLADVLKG